MEGNLLSPLAKIGENITSALDKFAGILKNRADLKYNKELKEIEKTDLQDTIKIIENASVPIACDKNGLKMMNPQMQELLKRTGNRLMNQEVFKQINVESTLEKTQFILEENKNNGDDNASTEPINNDFMTQFINGVGEISDQEMQMMWAKLLAGEIKQPSSFSLRTISKLKMMTTSEAKLFEKVAPYIIGGEYIVRDIELLKKYKVTYTDLLRLQDCEIISLEGATRKYHSSDRIRYGDLQCEFNAKAYDNNIKDISANVRAYVVTNFGKELLKIVKVDYNNLFFIDVVKKFKVENKTHFVVSCHEIKKR